MTTSSLRLFHIIDNIGGEVVTYSYDTWGKLLGIGGSLASTVGTANPFRYRGYYYDTETGLYYLQSRYYNPELERFISKDDPSDHDGINGVAANLYAYCYNSPVNYSDPSGHFALLVDALISGVVNATVWLLAKMIIYWCAHRNSLTGFRLSWGDAWGLTSSFLSGFALGLIPVLPNRAMTGLLTALGSVITDMVFNPRSNIYTAMQAAMIGFFSGYVACDLPARVKLNAAQVTEFAKAIFSMVVGDVVSYA